MTIYFSAITFMLAAQPAIQWQKTYGGSKSDYVTSIQQTSDGGYVFAGATESNDGDVAGFHGGYGFDIWVVKLTEAGKIQWQRAFGGSKWDDDAIIQQTKDGGYILTGKIASSDGDISGNDYLDFDIWAVKMTSEGNIQWQKVFGGNAWDGPSDVQQTSDGGYIIAATTFSNDGDITDYHGSGDMWIIKLTDSGAVQWKKAIGGNQFDACNSLRQTSDGGYIVAGHTTFGVFPINDHKDFWVVKLNEAGEMEWQKSYGGSNNEIAFSIRQTTDNGFIVTGHSNSIDGDVTDLHGYEDIWVVKLNESGDLQWQKTLGGNDNDVSLSIQQASDNGYIVAGRTNSIDGNVSGGFGEYSNCWIVKLSDSGDLQWQKVLGGSQIDAALSIQQTNDGGYIVGAYTKSNDGDVSENKGDRDCWVVKLNGAVSEVKDYSGYNEWKVSPNPATHVVEIQSDQNSPVVTVFLTDLLGKQMMVQDIYATGVINISNLPSGAYIITGVTDSGKRLQKKVLKQ